MVLSACQSKINGKTIKSHDTGEHECNILFRLLISIQLEMTIMNKCRSNIIFHINQWQFYHFVYTFIARKKKQHLNISINLIGHIINSI